MRYQSKLKFCLCCGGVVLFAKDLVLSRMQALI